MIDIKLNIGLSGYDVIAEYIRQFWQCNNLVETVMFSIGTSYDGHSYTTHNEIADPINGDGIEFLNDWWEGERYLRLGGIRSIDSIKLDISEEGEVKMSQIEKRLGKIDFAEFGILKDYPFLIGLHLGFSMGGCGVMDGGQYTVNISPECRWKDVSREVAVTSVVEKVNRILSDAKVCYVSDLVNKPVEVTLENGRFKSFRILTEVL